MKTIKGWWFAKEDKQLANGDNRKIKVGITHKVTGNIIPCEHGLHLSPKIIDALLYAPGPIIYKVEGSGKIVPHGNPIDKYACSERTYISGGFDSSEILRKFARLCALDVIHLWDAPQVVVEYLKTGNEDIRDAARAAAWDAARYAARAAARDAEWDAARAAAWDAARDAAWDAAWDAARAAARDAAWDAARAAARDAARAAARDAARDAAGAAAWAAAWDAARDAAWDAAWYAARAKQNERLTAMANKFLKKRNQQKRKLWKNINAQDV